MSAQKEHHTPTARLQQGMLNTSTQRGTYTTASPCVPIFSWIHSVFLDYCLHNLDCRMDTAPKAIMSYAFRSCFVNVTTGSII
jgi:hypothetical protein